MSTFPRTDTKPLPTPQPKPTRWQRLKRWAKDHFTPSHVIVFTKRGKKEFRAYTGYGTTPYLAMAFITPLFIARWVAKSEQNRVSRDFVIVTVERVEEL